VRRPGAAGPNDSSTTALDASSPATTSGTGDSRSSAATPGTADAPNKFAAATERVTRKRALEDRGLGVANANVPGASAETRRRHVNDDSASSASPLSMVDRPSEVRPPDAPPDPHAGSRHARVSPDPHVGSHNARMSPDPHVGSHNARVSPDPHVGSPHACVSPDPHVGLHNARVSPDPHVGSPHARVSPDPHVGSPHARVSPDPHAGSQNVQHGGGADDRRCAVRPAPTADRPSELIATQRAECARALVGLGWKSQIAHAATAAAINALGEAVPLERLIIDALRRCPRPRM
jgi:hypothetical protein